MATSFVSLKTSAGEPTLVGDLEVTPVSQALCVRLPRLSAGFIWNRPLSVLVRMPDGTEHELAVPDVTRQKQVLLLALGLAGSLLIWLMFRSRNVN